eukprot:g15054.t1
MEAKCARGEAEPLEPKIYRVWFMLRDLFFKNSRTLHRHDVLQVPDIIRKACMEDAGKSISSTCKRAKRLPFRAEANRRGVKHGRMLEFRLFSRGEMIDMLMEASLRGEGFHTPEDVAEAARLEMQHAFGQGILSRELSLENAHLTLKALFLYARSPGSERWANDREFWGGVVDIAARSDAGLCLIDVFRDDSDAHRAYKWMKPTHVDQTLPMANRIFVTPMFANEDEVSDDVSDGGDVEGVDDCNGISGDAAVERDIDDCNGISGDVGAERGDDDGGGVQSLVDRINTLGSCSSVVEAVVKFFRPRRGRMRGEVSSVENAPLSPPAAFKPDLDLVWRAGTVIGTRQAATEYRKEVKEMQVAEKTDDGDESGDDDGEESGSDDGERLEEAVVFSGEEAVDGSASVPGEQQGNGGASTPGEPDDQPKPHSTEPYINDWAAGQQMTGELPEEMLHLLQFGFFVVQTFPFWYICLIEHLALMTDRSRR